MYDVITAYIFVSEFALAGLVIICGIICLVYKSMKTNYGETYVKVCKAPTCQKLNYLMKNLIMKRLDFEDETQELEDVVKHLTEMYENVHKSNRQEMFQCIRTTLVQHPDDIRGRRRANVAREILKYKVIKVLRFIESNQL